MTFSFFLTPSISSSEILISCRDNTIKLLNFTASENLLRLKRSFQVSSKSTPVRSAFCPLSLPASSGLACIVAGSEDCFVYIFSTRDRPFVAKLQGHSGAVRAATFVRYSIVLFTDLMLSTLFR